MEIAMKKNIIEDLKKQNFLSILGYGWHEKSSFAKKISNIVEKETIKISFIEPIKKIIAKSFTEEYINTIVSKIDNKEFEKLNPSILEDKIKIIDEFIKLHPDVTVFGDLNMDDFINSLIIKSLIIKSDNKFKIKLVCLDLINKIKNINNPKKTLFVSTDITTVDEMIFFSSLNKVNNINDFLTSYISNSKQNLSDNIINEIFELRLHYDLSKEETNILFNIYKELEEKNKTINNINSKINIDTNKILNKTKSGIKSTRSDYNKISKYGIINIFRPLLDRKNLDLNIEKEDLSQDIIKYTGISEEELLTVKKFYEFHNIEFNIVNISNFGFLRFNPNLYSSKILEKYTPIAIVNHKEISEDDILKQLSYTKSKLL